MVALSSDLRHAEILLRKATRIASQLSTRCLRSLCAAERTKRRLRSMRPYKEKLANNLKLAKNLGAEVVTLRANHVVEALVTFGTTHNVKHAIFGKSRRSPFRDV